jgi:decaprenylphospho-beta-D-ribofuranose 2-oxidase
MPPTDVAAGQVQAPLKPTQIRTAEISGWGGGPSVPVRLVSPDSLDQLRASLAGPRVIARGMGRSYGDAAQLALGRVLDMTGLREFVLDAEQGTLTAQGGAVFADILDVLAPAGWTLPVVPGTQYVTVGGAIACDIHGKNHGVAGTFGSHVLELGLLTATGDLLVLTPQDNGDLLQATIGGMGLTGVIVWARIRLKRLPSSFLAVDTDLVESLEDALAVLDGPGGVYRVAWLDLLSTRLARGVVTRADHLPAGSRDASSAGDARTTVAPRLTIPAWTPGGLLQPSLVRAFNELRFRSTPRRGRDQVESFGAHMFPLDGLSAWPRLYGPQGFIQYQLVLPRGQETVLHNLLVTLRRSPVPCYLAVLKDFGPANSSPLSFPLQGWTLTLDIPRSAPGLAPLLRRFDDLLLAAGGRVYLAKDDRVAPDVLAAMYPRLDEWRAVRDLVDPGRLWASDLALRTELIGPA